MAQKFSRPFAKTNNRRSLLPSESVTQWSGWDVSLPNSYIDEEVPVFSASDLKKFEDEVVARLTPLLEHGAVDGAHGGILDKTAAAVFAPLIERAWETHHINERVLEALDGQARNVARKLAEQAAHRARLARDAENQADSVYLVYVGLTRENGRVEWNTEATTWDKISLTLASDAATTEYATLGFRGESAAMPKSLHGDVDDQDGNVTPIHPRQVTARAN